MALNRSSVPRGIPDTACILSVRACRCCNIPPTEIYLSHRAIVSREENKRHLSLMINNNMQYWHSTFLKGAQSAFQTLPHNIPVILTWEVALESTALLNHHQKSGSQRIIYILLRIKVRLLKYHWGDFFFFSEYLGSTSDKHLGVDNYILLGHHMCQSGREQRWMYSIGWLVQLCTLENYPIDSILPIQPFRYLKEIL